MATRVLKRVWRPLFGRQKQFEVVGSCVQRHIQRQEEVPESGGRRRRSQTVSVTKEVSIATLFPGGSKIPPPYTDLDVSKTHMSCGRIMKTMPEFAENDADTGTTAISKMAPAKLKIEARQNENTATEEDEGSAKRNQKVEGSKVGKNLVCMEIGSLNEELGGDDI